MNETVDNSCVHSTTIYKTKIPAKLSPDEFRFEFKKKTLQVIEAFCLFHFFR